MKQLSRSALARGKSYTNQRIALVLPVAHTCARVPLSSILNSGVSAQSKSKLFLYVARQVFDTAIRQGHEAAAAQPDEARAIAAYLDVGVSTGAQLSVAFLNDMEAMRQARELFESVQMLGRPGLSASMSRFILFGDRCRFGDAGPRD